MDEYHDLKGDYRQMMINMQESMDWTGCRLLTNDRQYCKNSNVGLNERQDAVSSRTYADVAGSVSANLPTEILSDFRKLK